MSRALALILSFFVFLVGFLPRSCAQARLPSGFVDVADVVPSLVVDLRYATKGNFVGRPVDGYVKPRCILTSEAAAALKRVQDDLARYTLGLKVFDAYRPQRAVDHFVRWSHDEADQRTKKSFYTGCVKAGFVPRGLHRRSIEP